MLSDIMEESEVKISIIGENTENTPAIGEKTKERASTVSTNIK